MPANHHRILLTLAGLASLTATAAAQSTDAPAKPADPEPASVSVPAVESPSQLVPRPSATPSFTLDLRPRAEYTFESSLDDADADLSVARAGLIADLAIPINERFRLALNTDFELSWYDFESDDTGSAGLFDDPLEDVYRFRVSPGFFYAVNQQWGVLAGGIVEIAGEAGADVADSTTWGGYVGARYAFSENFAMTGGVMAKTRIEDNALFLPIIGFEWKVNSRVTLSTSGPGFGLRLHTMIDEKWSMSLGAAWESRDFRLDDDAMISGGIARDERVPITLGVTYKPTDRVTLALYGGAIVWQELSLDDEDGNELVEDNTDPTPFVGFTASFRF